MSRPIILISRVRTIEAEILEQDWHPLLFRMIEHLPSKLGQVFTKFVIKSYALSLKFNLKKGNGAA